MLPASQLSYVVLEWKADTQLDRCLHSHHADGFHPSDNDYGLRVIYGFPGSYVKSEELRGLDSNPLALSERENQTGTATTGLLPPARRRVRMWGR